MMDKLQNQTFKIYSFIGLFVVGLAICYCFKLLILKFGLVAVFPQNPILDFYVAKNTGAAFSIFHNGNLLLGIFSFFVSVGIVFFVFKKIKIFSKPELYSITMLLAGVSSNMLERFVDGYVTDYFRLKFVDFPIFNVADVFINVAVVLILFFFLSKKDFGGVQDE